MAICESWTIVYRNMSIDVLDWLFAREPQIEITAIRMNVRATWSPGDMTDIKPARDVQRAMQRLGRPVQATIARLLAQRNDQPKSPFHSWRLVELRDATHIGRVRECRVLLRGERRCGPPRLER